MKMLTKQAEKSLVDLIPKDFTIEHEDLLSKLRIENREAYHEVQALASYILDDRNMCEEYGFDYVNQRMGDFYKLMYAFALEKGYIKEDN